jgi:dipeptidyl aminopeptidase/acylaminoacyl peptidase
MIKKLSLIVVMFGFISTSLSAMKVDPSVMSKITLDKGNAKVALGDNPFKQVVEQNFVNAMSNKIDQDIAIKVFNQSKDWESLTGDSSGTHLLRFSISANKFVTGKFTVSGAKNTSFYLNQLSVEGNNIEGDKDFSVQLLNQDYRALMVVSGVEQWQKLSIQWLDDAIKDTDNDTDNESNKKSNKDKPVIQQTSVLFGNDQSNKRASMKQYYDSETVGSLNISPDGELLVWSKKAYSDLTGDQAESVVEIINLDSQDVIYRWQAMTPRHIAWRSDSKALVFTHDGQLYQLSRKDWQLIQLASDLKGISGIDWLSDSELLIAWNTSEEKQHEFTKRYRGLEDRWNNWRGNEQLQLFDIHSSLFKQITHDRLSSYLSDIDIKNRKALIARNPIDYKAPPHGLTQLLELDLNTGDEKLVGEYRTLNSAQFHKDGFIINAGPDFKGGQGNNVSNTGVANDYDGQLYLMNKQGQIVPLSKDFKPAIGQVEVLNNGDLIVSTTDQDRKQLYSYDMSRRKFSKLDTEVEIVSGFSISKQNTPTMVYKGTSATRPQSVHVKTLRSAKGKHLFDSAKEEYAKVDFVDLKDWDYTTESGQTIDGRVYYPANFDKTKKYPAIVYYYAGTSPVSRSFTGRWPFSLWASQGYIVYVLQPSGATGYGQDFSARHVNAWGINTAHEIIESTQAFVKAHPFVDKKRLGNMGASYGGFMTMYLATKTDVFSASISHAGISNLTSYWGHGWWGYAYSGVATKGNFPWNNPDFYTQQSPVFAADKITTPLLLIHGDADTNVPVGESHQMYTALKLLDKDVEFIEFQGDDHHINSRERRLRWWKTILAYFDLKLKDEPLWWDHMYAQKSDQ